MINGLIENYSIIPAYKKLAQYIDLFLSWDKQILEYQELKGRSHIWPYAYP